MGVEKVSYNPGPSFATALRLFIVCGLALSIGWGIRGNFGHESGAMIPGALAAIGGCCLSGRGDWHRRVAYFGLFGALVWAFGGSASYMQVISYTHSGHLPSVAYGFFCLFVLGFLWGSLGGAGTAFPAVAARDQLRGIFRPILWVFAFWLVLAAFMSLVAAWEAGHADSTWKRHESALYWFDTDWLQALTALAALCALDLWDRRFGKAHWLAIHAAAGAVLGAAVYAFVKATGLDAPLAAILVQPQGDIAHLLLQPAYAELGEAGLRARLLNNWPNFLVAHPQHAGWLAGLLVGIGFHFARHGAFRGMTGLLACMAAGWLAAFLLGPVLFGFGGAGLRMTPPRGDNWAGLIGVVAGMLWWTTRNGLRPVAHAALLCGTVGGLGFAGSAFLKLLLLVPGNPAVTADPGAIAAWKHWQSANWHSFLEQTYGLFNGLGVALVLWVLARRQPETESPPRGDYWTQWLAVGFTLFAVTGLNVQKSIGTWVGAGSVPASMAMPLFDTVRLGAYGWFLVVYLFFCAVGMALLWRHRRAPLAFIPADPLGKGQLCFLALLWMVVVMNFERALPNFSDQRILTEGVIFVNAIIVSALILVWQPRGTVWSDTPAAWPLGRAMAAMALAALVSTALFTAGVRLCYGDAHAGHSKRQVRFGDDAEWRATPLMRGRDHA